MFSSRAGNTPASSPTHCPAPDHNALQCPTSGDRSRGAASTPLKTRDWPILSGETTHCGNVFSFHSTVSRGLFPGPKEKVPQEPWWPRTRSVRQQCLWSRITAFSTRFGEKNHVTSCIFNTVI